jgi:hypothetical protein
VVVADLPESFLPGVRIERGVLEMDSARLAHPGDLLHEAGHIAMTPAALRVQLSGAIDVPGLDMTQLEHAAVAWSYAAALAARIHPAEVFHADGYRGQSAGLLATFAAGVYPGAHLLVAAGMTTSEAYPQMLHWLRD